MLQRFLITAALTLITLASAHATVRTDAGATESKAGAYETYRLQVPVEQDVPTTGVRLIVPAGLKIGTFMPVPGWERRVVRDADGNITEVIWTGSIAPLEFQRFLISARNPAGSGQLTWVVHQTYADGTVVSWDDSSDRTPASKTTVK